METSLCAARAALRCVLRKVDRPQELILTSTLVLGVFTVIAGVAGMYFRPELASAGPVPYGWLAKQVAFV